MPPSRALIGVFAAGALPVWAAQAPASEDPATLPALATVAVVAAPAAAGEVSLPDLGRLDEAYAATAPNARTVLGREAIDARAADRLAALEADFPGLGGSTLNGGLSTVVQSRGFAITKTFWNGLPDIQRLYVRDLATVERVVLLRGPDAVLHGITSPGGVVHYVGKRPEEAPAHRLGLTLGSRGLWRGEVDSTGPIGPVTADSALSYRLVAARQDGTQAPGDLSLARWHGLGGLTWRYRPGGRLTLESETQQNHRPFSFGTVRAAGRVRYDQVYGDASQPSHRRYTRNGFSWEERFSPTVTLAAHYARSEAARDETLLGFWSVRDATSLWGYYTDYRDRYTQTDWRAEARLRFETGGWGHQLVLGHDRQRHRIRFSGVQNAAGFIIDLAAPDFSAIDPATLPLTPRFNHERHREQAWFVADRITLGPVWSWVTGWRRQRFETAADRSGSGLQTASRGAADSWHTGLVAEQGALRVHLTRASALEPNRGMTRSGGFLEPQTSRQVELGVQWSPRATWRMDATLFRIDLRNLPMTDPEDRTALISTGRRRVDGLEWAVHTAHSRWSASAHANWLDTRNLSKTPALSGDHFAGTPRFSGGVRVSRRHDAAQGRPWHSWLALAHVGKRYGDGANSFQVAAYWRADAGTRIDLPGGTVRLGIRNLADKRYVAAISSASDVHQGERRSLWASFDTAF